MIEKIDNFCHKFKSGEIKVRHSIKVSILNDLIYLRNYITTSPGIISPAKVEDKIRELKSLLKVWITNSTILNEFNLLSNEYIDRYIEMKNITVNPEKDSSEEEDKKLYTAPIPNYTKKLLKNIAVIRGDVSYLPIGPCCHYCIVYKIVDNIAFVIPMTTTPDVFNGYQISKSRFWRGTAIHAIYQFPLEIVEEKFTMPYDHKGELKEIFKSLELTIKNILPKERKRKS